MPSPPFRPGFRCSPLDGAVLATAGLGGAAVLPVSRELALLAVVVVLHFFLFCNVFRVARGPELLWSAAFLLGVGVRALVGVTAWPALAGCLAVVTAGVLYRETRKPSYHGALWRRWNPGLRAWWTAQRGEPDARAEDATRST